MNFEIHELVLWDSAGLYSMGIRISTRRHTSYRTLPGTFTGAMWMMRRCMVNDLKARVRLPSWMGSPLWFVVACLYAAQDGLRFVCRRCTTTTITSASWPIAIGIVFNVLVSVAIIVVALRLLLLVIRSGQSPQNGGQM